MMPVQECEEMEGLEEVGEGGLPWSLARSCPPGSQPNLPHMMHQNGNTMVSYKYFSPSVKGSM